MAGLSIPIRAARHQRISADAASSAIRNWAAATGSSREDLSDEHAWQFSQEFRLASNFSGPFNFSVGGNYLHYETEENYYVFINALTLRIRHATASTGSPDAAPPWVPGVSATIPMPAGRLRRHPNPNPNSRQRTDIGCVYIDPNPIGSLNNEGHNYFLSQNPYTLNSYAGFGEAYYNITQRSEADGGLALDRRPEALHRYSERARRRTATAIP